MGFDFGRDGFPTQYSEVRTAVTVDILESGLILAFVLLFIAFCLILPGSTLKTQFYLFTRIFVSLTIGVLLLLNNYGQEWEVGTVHTKTSYRAGIAKDIDATIKLKLGLRSLNVTLLQDGESKDIPKEKIDYNERFSWEWDQGRFGFGPAAGHLQQNFREGQRIGLPLPILWVVDYFVVDGEGLRYGRFYRTAGWYTHILLWFSVPIWILSNVMFLSVVRYGAGLLSIVGCLQLIANLVWAVIRNPIPLIIPFENGEIVTVYGVNFWLNFASGICCFLLGGVVLFLDLRYPDEIAIYFGLDPLSDYEEVQITKTELDMEKMRHETLDKNDIEMESQEVYSDIAPTATFSVLKRRSTIKIAQKSLYRSEIPIELADYGNTMDEGPTSSGGDTLLLAPPPRVPNRAAKPTKKLY